MTVSDVLSGVQLKSILTSPLAEQQVSGLEYDSRRVSPGNLFFAFPGARTDGRQFAAQALESGAVCIVSELAAVEQLGDRWIQVEHGRRALALAARNYYGDLSRRLLLTGITGTNGKTTSSYLIDSVLRRSGLVTGLVGTIEYHVAGAVRPAVNTTPESLDVYRLLGELESAGGRALTMEVSSHGLALGRVWGIHFHTTVFTNLTRDHLDFHASMDDYYEAKAELFTGQDAPPPRYAVINSDDPYGRRIRTLPGTETLTYGIESAAALRARQVRTGFEGLVFELQSPAGSFEVKSPLLARINVYNILAAIGVGMSYGIPMDTILAGIEACRSVPGRFERVDAGQPFLVVVDYAHTDDALRNTIQAARALKPGRVITLFGCGGDRDRAKRPLMGKAAAELSDFVVLTSDNPRSEDPVAIMNDALVGICRYDTPYRSDPDRARAIRTAIAEAQPGDLVLLAGKGHETYQVLRDRTIAFDDRAVARDVLRELGFGGEQ